MTSRVVDAKVEEVAPRDNISVGMLSPVVQAAMPPTGNCGCSNGSCRCNDSSCRCFSTSNSCNTGVITPESSSCSNSCLDQHMEERHLVWRKNAPFFYDTILSHKFDWPSMTVRP